MPRTRGNDKCPCGSGRGFKKCCGKGRGKAKRQRRMEQRERAAERERQRREERKRYEARFAELAEKARDATLTEAEADELHDMHEKERRARRSRLRSGMFLAAAMGAWADCDAPKTPMLEAKHEDSRPARATKVLAVDDDSYFRQFWAEQAELTMPDVEVDVAASFNEAAQALAANRYDAVVSDGHLPEADGMHPDPDMGMAVLCQAADRNIATRVACSSDPTFNQRAVDEEAATCQTGDKHRALGVALEETRKPSGA
jgi:CheY-like chemotaxis protein